MDPVLHIAMSVAALVLGAFATLIGGLARLTINDRDARIGRLETAHESNRTAIHAAEIRSAELSGNIAVIRESNEHMARNITEIKEDLSSFTLSIGDIATKIASLFYRLDIRE